MIKRFFRDSVIYTLSYVFTRGVSILLFPLYVNILTPSDYGVLDLIQVVISFALISVSLEVGQGLARYIPECSGDLTKKKAYFSTTFYFTLFTFLVVGIVLVCFSRQLSALLFNGSGQSVLVVLMALIAVKTAVINQIIIQLQADLKTMKSALLSFLSGSLSIVFSFLMLLVFKQGLLGAVLAQVYSGFVVLAVGVILVKDDLSFTFDRVLLKKMLVFSIPLVPSSAGVILAMYIDRIAIKTLMQMSDLGLYGVAFRLASVVTFLMVGFQRAITPLIYHNYTNPETPQSIASLFRLFLIGSLVFISGLSLFSLNVLHWIAPPEYLEAAKVVPMMVLGILLGRIYLFAPGLSIAEETKKIAVINIITAIVNTGLNFLFIPFVGMIGAVLGTLLGNLVMAGGYFYFGQKKYHVPYDRKSIIVVSLLSSLIVMFVLFYDNLSLVFLVIKAIVFLASLCVLFVSGVVRKDDLASLFYRIRVKLRGKGAVER